jgi:hypothetical protein
MLTGPLVANTSAGRDTFCQLDFPKRADMRACSRMEIGSRII